MKNRLTAKSLWIGATIAVLAFTVASCDKWVETKPPGELLVDEAIKSTEDCQRLLNSAYNELANSHSGNTWLFSEMMADNVSRPNNNDYREVYDHNTLFFNSAIGTYYGQLYTAIFRANFVAENLDKATDMTELNKNRITGESRFIRALCHFATVRQFAQPWNASGNNDQPGIALALKTSKDPLPRSTVSAAYASIIADLQEAIAKLPTSNGNYASSWSAKGLLAEVYFQQGKYDLAGNLANDVIANGGFLLSDTTTLFVPKSYTEHVFSIVSTATQDNRSSGWSGNFSGNPPLLFLDKVFYNSIADTNDKRLKYLTVFNAGKPNEYITSTMFMGQFLNFPIVSLTALKLIRAESYAKQGVNLNIAITDINDITNRAYKNNTKLLTNAATATQIINEVRAQRRMELLFMGNRIHELKRLGAIEGQNISIRGHKWDCKGLVLQFPVVERTSIFELNPTGGCD